MHNRKKSVLLLGDQPWTRDLVHRESLDAGLRVVFAKLMSDSSETIVARLHRGGAEDSEERSPTHATEILPDEATAISDGLLARLRQRYGEDWSVLPLNDYVTEYAAIISSHLSNPCYPPRSAQIVKRKHELRQMWNEMAGEPGSRLRAVEYCYAELRGDASEFDFQPSPGFGSLPEETSLIVKPDELSGSIEIMHAVSKREAVALARKVCDQLLSKWYAIGRSIGTEVRPRVVIEEEIERSEALHPGAEFSAEFVSHQGEHYPVGITQKWIGGNFIEAGHLFPAESFPPRLRPALEEAIHRLLERLGARYCVSHWEFIITPDERIALVEGHLRSAGGRIMELVEQSVGRSPTGALCEALGRGRADFSFKPLRSCGVFWMVPERSLEKVVGVKVERAEIEGLYKDLYINE